MKKTIPIATLLIIFLTSLVLQAQTYPVVTSTLPVKNEIGVSRNANIVFTFDGPMSPFSISGTPIIGSQTGPLTGTFTHDPTNTIFTFNPTNDFKAGETITVTVTEVLGGGGNNIPYSFSFTTAVAPALEDPAAFEAATIEDTGDAASGLYVVDVDGDGDLDVLASFLDDATLNDAAYSVTWYENNGGQNFAKHSITNSATAPLRAHDVHAADMDGDGDVDILSADDNGVYWYESDGNANPGFSDHKISGAEGGARDIYVADVDSDGDMDVLRAFYLDDTIAWYENNGNANPGFTYRVIYASANSAESVHAADVDGDGDMDVLSASESDDTIAWYENDGNSFPGFTYHHISNTFGNNTRKVYAGDLDGDLDMDVLFGYGNTIAWHENTGGGSFGSAQTITSSAITIQDIYISDVDGDGDRDVLSASYTDNTIAWHENDGFGNPGFTAHDITTSATHAAALYVADLDGDLDMDVLSGTSYGDGKVTWYENRADPPVITAVAPVPNSIGNPVNTDITFTFDHPIETSTINNSTIIVRGTRTGLIAGTLSGGGTNTITFDPTNDFKAGERIIVSMTTGLLSTDGLAINAPYSYSFLATVALPAESPPVFYPKAISTTADGARDVHAADMDGDGDMDVLSASFNDDTIAWYENSGNANFTAHVLNDDFSVDGPVSVYAADVDSDGDMDALSASVNDDRIAWFENINASPEFTRRTISLNADGAHDVYAVDVDSDGDMDVVSASENDNEITLYENNGSQSFSVDIIENFANKAHSVYAADVDGDRDIDLLSAWGDLFGGSIDWYKNGAGFVDYSYPIQSGRSVFAGDMDGDGDMDMLLATEYKINWYENGGQADPAFTVHQIDTFGNGRSVFATDMDGDGDLDVLSTYGNTVAWYENDGNGNFSTEKTITTTANVANSVHAADMDGDGDMDVLSASTNDDTIAWYESDDSLTTIYVDESGGNDSNTGENWAQAFKTLTKALSEADGRDQVWIAEGTYYPDEGPGATNDDRNASFTITGAQDGLEIYGGFAGTETQLDQQDPSANPVILSGDINGDGTVTGNSYHVLYFDGTTGGGITNATILDGVTVTAGNADGSSPDNRAGGLYCIGNGSESVCSPSILNTVFVDNDAVTGGAIYMFGGGGISSPVIVNCAFIGNGVTLRGGAIQTNGNGGGQSSPVIINSTFTGNHSNGNGGAIDNSAVSGGTSAPQISNSIFWGNTATGNGNQIYNNDSNPTLSHTIIEGGLAGISNIGVSSTTDGGGNLFINPLFTNIADPDGADNTFGTADDGLILPSTSPAISAGDNNLYEAPDGNSGNNSLTNDKDLSGNPRLIGTTIDIGAYESLSGADYVYDSGSWTPSDPSGVATVSNDILVRNGTTMLSTDTQMDNLFIVSGATLEIEGVLSPSGTIENNGALVFVSDGTKLGQLDDMSGSTITGSGSVTVQRYIPAKRAFRFISPAVTTTSTIHDNWQEGATSNTDNPNLGFGTHITGSTTDQTNGFDGTISGNHSLFLFDNSAQTWYNIANTDVNTLTTGKAYRLFVRGSRDVDLTNNSATPSNTILRATGDLVLGNYTDNNLGQIAGDFNFIGNPYQAIVNMNDVLANSTNLNPNFYYVWDPNLGTRGAYATVDLTAETTAPLASDADQFLQPGQAAFVTTATNGPAFILFEEPNKAPFEVPTDVFRGAQNNTTYINLQLYEAMAYTNGGSVADGLRINFSQGGSNAVLLNDAAKLPNIDENICLVNGNAYLSIENRALPIDGETLPLFNNQYRHDQYTYKINAFGFAKNVRVYLHDNYLNIQTELINNTVTIIDFQVDENIPESITTNRFSIVFSVSNFSIGENSIDNFKIYPNPTKTGNFFIDAGTMSGNIKIALYDMLGRKVYSAEKEVGPNNRIEVKTSNLEAGVYLLEMNHNGKTHSGKIIFQQ